MRVTSLFSILSAVALAAAESIPETEYDVIVVGGGPSGLSALSGVSRVRRTALLFDDHQYRNAPTRNMHDVIGNDGTPPDAFRALAREQISKYPTAHFSNATVSSITATGNGNFSAFSVADSDGKTHTARKVVLGTGMKDILPDTPGLQEAWGKGIFWCPWCDGYEHRDQPFGILGPVSDVLGSMLEVNTQFTDIIAFVNGTLTPEGKAAATKKHKGWEEQLQAWNIKLENRIITRIERLQDGETHQNKTADLQFDKFLRSTLPEQMHLNVTDDKIVVNFNGMGTNLTGVFAVGDANSDGSTNVPHAMFSGKRAAVYLHVEMSTEESTAKVARRNELLTRRMLEKEAVRAIGANLEPQWEQAQRKSSA
ncbi:FAD/NAD(P)-binding domain-containing protein [Aspergillus floccosus]